ncbi:MAG: TonB-dependent receptor [Gammaproteobacteria bacterium]|nr:TonB-dependent receptor [Gammaproteobacteria bacterium]
MDARRAPPLVWQFIMGAVLTVLIFSSGQAAPETKNLIDLSLEELLQVTVTSVSRKPQTLSRSAAAIFVVTQDDIRHSGARTIPDVLRMVPGMQVAQIDASSWAVTSRGSNGLFANKLLVLLDGRTLYDPLFSGVYWDSQDTDLSSIERIEVIRGPGAAMWGANAVNGVINIITKNAKDTHGTRVAVASGTSTNIETNVRQGGAIGENVDYRVYAKYFSRDGFDEESVGAPYDDWDFVRVGGRLDWNIDEQNTVTFNSEYYNGESGENVGQNSLTPPYNVTRNIDTRPKGGFISADWRHRFSDTSDLNVKLYYDRRERTNLAPNEKRDTYDLDVQHRFQFTSRNDVVWGFGIRHSADKTTGDETISLTPSDRTQRLYSAFIQDEYALIADELFLTVGTKLEKNNFADDNTQWSPNIRISWIANETNSFWGSIAKAIRTPSRVELNGRILGSVVPPFTPPDNPGPVPFALTINGNSELKSEEVIAYEIGYRTQPTDKLTLDIALFYNDYDDVRDFTGSEIICQPAGLPITDPACFFGAFDYSELPLTFVNSLNQDTKGIEIATTYQATDWWRLEGAYTYLNIGGDTVNLPQSAGEDNPRHQLSLRSGMEVSDAVRLDIWARYVDKLTKQDVDSYTTIDTRLAWQVSTAIELSLTGRNLIEHDHLEFREEFGTTTFVEIEREVIAEVEWRF